MDLENARILNKAIEIRERIIDDLVVKGTPSDKDDRFLLVNMLNGIEKVAISRAKIAADEQANTAMADMGSVMSALLKRVTPSTHRLEVPEIREMDTLPSDLEEITFVPGEMDTGVITYDLNSISGAK